MTYISFPLPVEVQSRVWGGGAGMFTGEKAPWACQPHQH